MITIEKIYELKYINGRWERVFLFEIPVTSDKKPMLSDDRIFRDHHEYIKQSKYDSDYGK